MERDGAYLDDLCASFFYRGGNMETSQRGGGGGGGVGGQFRKANIVYFLSRNGTVEHPHLLRVHHHRNNGVHLRDVKRWLGELRGKDMPDSFAWSYKRRYKNGYVWQDLKEEDLITPISDNEYVLKGSFLQFHSLRDGFPSDHVDMTVKTPKGPAEHQVAPEPKPELPETLHIEPPRQPDRDSPVKTDRRLGDDVDRRMAVFRIDAAATARKQQEEEGEEKQRFRRSYSSRASHVFRNILTCGAADANEAVLGPHRRRSTSDVPPRQQPSQHQGSEGDNSSRKSRRSSGGKSGGPTGYKPLGAPNCLQCGRQFDPEKFHAHMQSCRGLRGSRRKGRPSVDRVPLRRESHRD